ncbi:peroxisomal membrane protein 2 [Planococcus citri]|uniref:peroxisomal membrane protein 2 n=1 Tax=Planococcus citri TaxID=170843 RepID=UPI0031F8AE01
MALSKVPNFLQGLVASYFEQLYVRPIRTKALTSCFISAFGNLIAQYIGGAKMIDQDSVIAFGLFGLMFGGPVPHFFYQFLDKVVPYNSKHAVFKKLFIERLLFTPFYQYFVLYTISRLQGKSHKEACKERDELWWTLLKANLHVVTLIQFFSLKYVHPMLRVLVGNLVSFFWIIYFAYAKQAAAKAAAAAARKKKIHPSK